MNRAASLVLTFLLIAGGLLAFTTMLPAAAAAGTTRYFVFGGAGCDATWQNANCWSFTSNGAGGAGQPTIDDDAVFDLYSGDSTVAVNVHATAHDLLARDGSFNGILMDGGLGGTLTLAGSLTVQQTPFPSAFQIQ